MKLFIRESNDDIEYLHGRKQTIKAFIHKAVDYFYEEGYVPSDSEVRDYILSDRWAKANIYYGDDFDLCRNKPGFTCVRLDKICKTIQKLCDDSILFDESLTENACTAAIGNIKNQVMQLVKDAFEFFGGSFTPEFIMQSNEKPDVEIKVKANGRNIEIIPTYKHIPDYAHIKKGISISNAPKAIADVALDAVETYNNMK